MVSALDSGLGGLGLSTSRGTALCWWARHFTIISLLSTQVVEIPLVTSCYINWDKLRPDDRPLGSYADLT